MRPHRQSERSHFHCNTVFVLSVAAMMMIGCGSPSSRTSFAYDGTEMLDGAPERSIDARSRVDKGEVIAPPADARSDLTQPTGGTGGVDGGATQPIGGVSGAGGASSGKGGMSADAGTPQPDAKMQVIPTVGVNQLNNPGFEEGTAGWSKLNGKGVAATPGHLGQFSLVEPNLYEWWWQGIPDPQGGRSYTFSAWARSPLGGCILAVKGGLLVTGADFRFEGPPAGTEWTQITFNYTLPKDVGWFQVALIAGDANCSYDDVVVKLN